MILPEDFKQETRTMMGEELFQLFVAALGEEPPTSIRLNPILSKDKTISIPLKTGNVPWCDMGVYLKERPNFTFDPLLHAGMYYVQEASSMFVYHVLRQYVQEPVVMLDLCAAPGGKTTCAMSALPQGSVMFSNEPIRNRAQILAENIQKFGHSGIIVTNNYPKDYKKTRLTFDIVLCDVPCSGEGMFRKDDNAIREWSLSHVAQCQQLQRSIVADAWHCLKPGGLLIYSTCTFNIHENEENVEWICQELGAKVLPVQTEQNWMISPSLHRDFRQPVYRFIPGKTIGEGLFMAVMQKYGNLIADATKSKDIGNLKAIAGKQLNLMGNDFMHSLQENQNAPRVELTYQQAISYLRREALTLPAETPRGIVLVTYQGIPLGIAKNIGNRANNLYPKEWRIKSTHIPEEPHVVTWNNS